jgi:hypothetical protein
MARNETFIAAAMEDVFALLADPATSADWVVGSRDRTRVLGSSPPRWLVLHARARPLPSARITFYLRPEGNGTRVTMIEDFASRVVNFVAGPLGHAAMRWRNRETLRRLKGIAEGELARAA